MEGRKVAGDCRGRSGSVPVLVVAVGGSYAEIRDAFSPDGHLGVFPRKVT